MACFCFFSLESIESNTDCSQSHTKSQHNPEERICLDHGPPELEDGSWLGVRRPNLRLVFRHIQHFLQILKNLERFDREKKTPVRLVFFVFSFTYSCKSRPYLNVELEGSEGLLQHLAPLLLGQLHAVHPAAVQLFEQVGAGDAGESEERQAVPAAQLQGFLGDPTQDLPSRQVTQVAGVSVGHQVLGILLPDLKRKRRPLLLF